MTESDRVTLSGQVFYVGKTEAVNGEQDVSLLCGQDEMIYISAEEATILALLLLKAADDIRQ